MDQEMAGQQMWELGRRMIVYQDRRNEIITDASEFREENSTKVSRIFVDLTYLVFSHHRSLFDLSCSSLKYLTSGRSTRTEHHPSCSVLQVGELTSLGSRTPLESVQCLISF